MRLISSESRLHPSFDTWEVRSARGEGEGKLTSLWTQVGYGATKRLDTQENRSDIGPALRNTETRERSPSGLTKALRGVASTLFISRPLSGLAQRFPSMVPYQPPLGNPHLLRAEHFGRSSCPFCYLKSRLQAKAVAADIKRYVRQYQSLPLQLDLHRPRAVVSTSRCTIATEMSPRVVLHAEPDPVLLTNLGVGFLICAAGPVPGPPPVNGLTRARILSTLVGISSKITDVSVTLLTVDSLGKNQVNSFESADTMLMRSIRPYRGVEPHRLAASASREAWTICATCHHHVN